MFARMFLNRSLLTVGSGLLIATATTVIVCCLWLLGVRQGETDRFALATVITAFIAASFAVIPATSMAAFMVLKSFEIGDAPYHCLPTRMRDPFRGATAAAFALSAVPCALGISVPSTYGRCSTKQAAWHHGLPCHMLKASWALCLVMMTLTVIILFPLRSAVVTSAIVSTKATSDTESTSSSEKPPIAAYGLLAAERPPTREQQRWQQRHNSLSTQKAIYPYAFDSPRSVSKLGPGGYSPFPRPSSSWRAYSFSDTQPSLTFSGSTAGTRLSMSRPSTAGSRPVTGLSFSTGSTYSRRNRLDHSSACPDIPESPLRPSFSGAVHGRPKTAGDTPALPVPAWCPPLTHPPLSSDPAIRALTGSSSRLSQRQSRLPALTGISPVLSRQSTTSTSVLDPSSRPSTAPSINITAVPQVSSPMSITSPLLPRNLGSTFTPALSLGHPASGQHTLIPPHLALPTLPGLAILSSPSVIPQRAKGHFLSPHPPLQAQLRSPSLTSSPVRHGASPRMVSTARSTSRSGSTARYLRSPSLLSVKRHATSPHQQGRSQSGVRKAGKTGHAKIQTQAQSPARSQSRGRSHRPQGRYRSSMARTPDTAGTAGQTPPLQSQQQYKGIRGRCHTKKPTITSNNSNSSVSRGRTPSSKAVMPPLPPVPQGEGYTRAVAEGARKSIAVAVSSAVQAGMSMRSGKAVVSVHEQRGREKIRREGWYAPSCYSTESGGEVMQTGLGLGGGCDGAEL